MTRRGRFAAALSLAPVYAVCYSAIKVGLAYAPPLRYGGLRAVAAGVSLLVLLRVLKRPVLPPIRLWPGTVALAVTGTLLAYGAMFSSPGRTGAGIASVLGNTTPLLVTALAVPFLGETVSRAKASALALGFAGAVLIAYPALTAPAYSGIAGVALPLTAAAGFAISSVIFKRINAEGQILQVAAWQLLLGGVPLLGLSAMVESQAIDWTATFVALVLFLAIIGTAATTAVWFWLVQHDDVGRLSIALFLVPAFGLGLAVGLFHEPLAPTELLGIGVVLAALGVMALDGGSADLTE